MLRKIFNYLGIGIALAALTVLSVQLFELFRHYVNGEYGSDNCVHIKTVVEGRPGYSLVHKLFGFCFRFPDPYKAIVILMTTMIILTIVGHSIYIIRRTNAKITDCVPYLVAIGVLFTSNVYIPSFFPHLYNHYTTVSQPWHNTTYICMRVLSVFVLILFFEIYEKVKSGKFPIVQGILFCVILTLCNSAKPNFFLAFAPMALIAFIYLFIREKGKNILNLLKWGVCFLLSMPIIYYMSQIVYSTESGSEEGSSAGLTISTEAFMDFFAGDNGAALIFELSNLLFPLFVFIVLLVCAIQKKTEFSRIVWGFVLYITAHMEQLLLVDGDKRADDGNYAWGVYNAGILLTLICITEWIRAYKKGQIHNKPLYFTGLVLFVLQSVCGIIYFVTVCRGISYLV